MRIRDRDAVRRLLSPTVSGPAGTQLVEMVAESGALLHGHFRLQSGFHSEYFLRFGQLAFRQKEAEQIAAILVGLLSEPVDRLAVLGADTSARYLATSLARLLHVPLALAKTDDKRRPTSDLVDAHLLERARMIVIATDVINTGLSIKPMIDSAKKLAPDAALRVVAFATLEPEEASRNSLQKPLCLMQAQWKAQKPEDCTLCHDGPELLPGFEFS
jgi:orotate phosphoribosyltransferase